MGRLADVDRLCRSDISHGFPEAEQEWTVAAAEVVDRMGRPVLLSTTAFGPIGVRFRLSEWWDVDMRVPPGGSLQVSLRPPWPDQPPPVRVELADPARERS
jgi:hypothetical protein